MHDEGGKLLSHVLGDPSNPTIAHRESTEEEAHRDILTSGMMEISTLLKQLPIIDLKKKGYVTVGSCLSTSVK